MPGALAAALNASGMDAIDARDVGLTGYPDVAVMTRAQSERRAVVTSDVGFGNIVAYPLGTHAGVVLVRLPEVLAPRIVALVVGALAALPADEVRGNLVVIDERRVRVRRSP